MSSSYNAETKVPVWLKVSGTGKAHLVNHGTAGYAAWCGISLQDALAGTYDERCKDCVTGVREFVESALIDPPRTITSSFYLTVTRPATSEDPVDVLRRKLTGRTTWEWSVHPTVPF